MSEPINVLFLCWGNSARSIFSEYLLRHMAGDRFNVRSAGDLPAVRVHPMTLRVLAEYFGIDARGAYPKRPTEFVGCSFDLIVSLCDPVRESYPEFSQPALAHWRIPDPASFHGADEEKYRVFLETALQIQTRLKRLTGLPLEKFDRLRLQDEAVRTGRDAQEVSP